MILKGSMSTSLSETYALVVVDRVLGMRHPCASSGCATWP